MDLATQVETANSHIYTLPVVRKFGHEWNFSFLWVNVSQSDAFATDGKILYRACKQKRTRQIGSTLRGHEAPSGALSVYFSVYFLQSGSCLSLSVVKPQRSPAMAGGRASAQRPNDPSVPPMRCPELSNESMSLALFGPHSLAGTKSHLPA